MKIVVLAGGLSTERDVSFTTGTMVLNALRSMGHRAMLVDVFFGVETLPDNIDDFFVCGDPLPARPVGSSAPDIPAIRASRPDSGLGDIGKNLIEVCKAADIVFMALHGENGENGRFQAMFDVLGIRYTGTGYLGSALAMDKGVTKQIFTAGGVKTPFGRIYRRGDDSAYDFPLPCIVKPCSGGSSVGVTKAFDKAALAGAIDASFAYDSEILIESFLTGRELTCAVLDGKALPPAEIIPKGDFYDYEHKYQDGLITEVCPAKISEELTERIMRSAEQVFSLLKLDVYARMDYILTGDGELYCLEANTLPGMTPTSHLPCEARAAGIDYNELCTRIIELSLKARQGAEK